MNTVSCMWSYIHSANFTLFHLAGMSSAIITLYTEVPECWQLCTVCFSTDVPRDLTFYSCPVLDDDTVGLCSEECSSDTDCKSYHKCCSNGCGHSCIDPIMIPFVPPPRSCPDYYEHALCDVQECTGSCADPRKLCCQNTCGSQVCTTGELPAFPCSATTSSLTGGALLGQYIPQCSDDGLFRSLQCSSHYCWCVDSQTGEPTSDMKENGHVNELECGGELSHTHTHTQYTHLNCWPRVSRFLCVQGRGIQ